MSQFTILDGGMGQELIKRSINPPTPLWSARVMMDEPEIVEAAHRDYVNAGAHYITLNTYSVTPERLARDASEDLFEPLQAKAIEIAKTSVEGSNTKIAGCLSPLFGSYHPDWAPDYAACLETYRRIVACQAAEIDIFLCETMSSIKEASASTAAAKESGKPVWCAVSVTEKDGTLLRSGENLKEAIPELLEAGADAILVNCSPPEVLTEGMDILSQFNIPFGGYANGFTSAENLAIGGTVDVLEARHDLGPEEYAGFCEKWIGQGATIIGGCCEVGPEHIAELSRRFS